MICSKIKKAKAEIGEVEKQLKRKVQLTKANKKLREKKKAAEERLLVNSENQRVKM